MAMDLDAPVAASPHHDFLATIVSFAAKTPDGDPIDGECGQRTAASRVEVPLHGFDGARAFNAQRGHGPAARRSKLHNSKGLRR
jgi:hypothetical protein